ncbi:hypothetical protein [Urbifossiella limnaea]|uniref:Uncharacterized protein n=1 Tax=Urbifossiella limnaea TaxID=2528023 RepID=A0A517XUU6_9BACT|nr:hypothetical protein [Urbifossiella limnaea]QDU21282.1 hypothetical protein ETAA1_32480 [Urbifossiella limnaea]
MADDLPPGVYFEDDGRVATVVFDGTGPDPAALAGLEARLTTSSVVITTPP